MGRFESGTGLTDDNKIVIKVIKENQNSTFVYRYMEKDGWARRMIVLGKDGEVCIGNDASQTGGGNDGIADGSITFNAETVAKIDGWKFQQRPLHWVEFRNVSLEPGKLTTVEVKDAVDENKPATVTNPNDTVAWPKGVDIKLLAVNDHPSRPGWWQADGTPAGEMKPFTNTRSTNLKPDEKFMARYFALDLTGIPATTGGLKLEGDSDAGPLEDLYDLDSGMHKPAKDWEYMSINPHRCEARVPRQAKTVTLRVGVPFGSWATSTPIPPASLQAEQKADGTLAVTTGYSDEEGKPRLVAITTDGRTIISSLRLVSRNGKELAKASGLWEFSNLPLAQVKEFRFQVRPYHWTVFRNVAVQPAAQAKNPPANLDLSLAPNWKAATPGQPSATATPTFEALTAEATMIIRKYFRDAQISFKDDEFVAKYSTQEFQVHTRFMTGKVSTDTHKEVGPAANGFILTINRQGKQQPEQAFMPHTAQYEYWQSYVSHAFPVRLMFDFGPQLEPAFKKEMFELLKRGQPETGYSEPTEP